VPHYSTKVQELDTDGYGANSLVHLNQSGAFVTEVVLTVVFVTVILFATHKAAIQGAAGLAIDMALVVVHLIGNSPTTGPPTGNTPTGTTSGPPWWPTAASSPPCTPSGPTAWWLPAEGSDDRPSAQRLLYELGEIHHADVVLLRIGSYRIVQHDHAVRTSRRDDIGAGT
jgi:hypothetical protein